MKNMKNMKKSEFVKIMVPAWFEQGTWPSNLENQRLDQLSWHVLLFGNGVSGIKTRVAFWLPRSRAIHRLLRFENLNLQRRPLLDAMSLAKIKNPAYII